MELRNENSDNGKMTTLENPKSINHSNTMTWIDRKQQKR